MTRAAFILLLCPALQAQITLRQAVDLAIAKYPSVQASLEQVKAAAAGVNLARTAYLPRADFLVQVNRSTHNNIFGLMLPQPLPVIPSISGPVLNTNSFDTVWGSAAGLLVSWEPFDFGQRRANVAAAEASRSRAAADVAVTRLQVAAAAADAFLTLQAAEQTERAAAAAVTRAESFQTVIDALVNNELRPGAEASRSRAEVAAARTQLIQAQQAIAIAKVALSQLIGIAPESVTLAEGRLNEAPAPDAPAPVVAPAIVEQNPFAAAQKAAVNEEQAREKALDHTYVPKINLEGAAYGRGTGIQANGNTGGPFSGLGPDIQNWSLGVNITFPAFDLPAIRAKKDMEAHRELAEEARYKQVVQDLSAQVSKANAMLDGARRIAENTPSGVDAARAAESQARARYNAGLGTITDVADTERLLTQAEIDDALARLNIWRGMLGVAAARGDLTPFLTLAEGK